MTIILNKLRYTIQKITHKHQPSADFKFNRHECINVNKETFSGAAVHLARERKILISGRKQERYRFHGGVGVTISWIPTEIPSALVSTRRHTYPLCRWRSCQRATHPAVGELCKVSIISLVPTSAPPVHDDSSYLPPFRLTTKPASP